MIISDKFEKLILEIKRFNKQSPNAVLSQMASYLRLTKINQGLVYEYSNSENAPALQINRHELYIEENRYTVSILA